MWYEGSFCFSSSIEVALGIETHCLLAVKTFASFNSCLCFRPCTSTTELRFGCAVMLIERQFPLGHLNKKTKHNGRLLSSQWWIQDSVEVEWQLVIIFLPTSHHTYLYDREAFYGVLQINRVLNLKRLRECILVNVSLHKK